MRKPDVTWSARVAITAGTSQGDRLVTLTLIEAEPGWWTAMAVESAARPSNAPRLDMKKTFGDAAEHVLNDHAHEMLTTRLVSFLRILAICERWIVRWKSRRRRIDACACGPIAKPRKPAKKAVKK